MQKLNELEKSRNTSISRAYRKVSRDSVPDENSQTYLTPKTLNKHQNANKTTGGKKKSKTATTFRFLAADFPAERTSAPRNQENIPPMKNPSSTIKQKAQTADQNLNYSKNHNTSQASSNIASPKNSFTTRVLDIHLAHDMDSSSQSVPVPLKSNRNLTSSGSFYLNTSLTSN